MKKIIAVSIIAIIASSLLTGCFKDKYKIDVVDNTSRIIVEFKDGLNDINQINLDYASGLVDVGDVVLRVDPRSVQDKDVTVKVTLNPTIIADYNSANGTAYAQLPATAFSVESYTVNVPASARQASLKLKINPSLVISGTYALGLSITETNAGEISKTYRNVLYAISVKNKYDGIYRLKAYTNLGTNTSAPYLVSTDCAYELELVTTGINSVRMGNQPLWRNNTFSDGFCNVNFDFAFNTTTDKVTGVTSYASAGCGGAPIAVNFPGAYAAYDSRYDPATKTIFVKFGLNNSSTWNIVDTLIYCGPR
jgi:hypothetical protein